MPCLTMRICSEKCSVRWIRHCASTILRTSENLDDTAYQWVSTHGCLLWPLVPVLSSFLCHIFVLPVCLEIKKNRRKWRELVCTGVCVCSSTGGQAWAGDEGFQPPHSHRQLAEPLFKPSRTSRKFSIVVVKASLLLQHCQCFSFNPL